MDAECRGADRIRSGAPVIGARGDENTMSDYPLPCETPMTVADNDPTYSIGEAADVLGVSIPTLRLYEQHGLIIPLRRDSGHRRYATNELDRVRRIRAVIHAHRYTLESLREYFAWLTHHEPPECIPHDGAAHHLPCWMHPSHTPVDRSVRCRECERYTLSVDRAFR